MKLRNKYSSYFLDKDMNGRIFLSLKVQYNYHIELREDRHYYSVPWQYKGKQVTVIYTDSVVEIYHKHIRIALHKRVHKRGYTTLKEHIASSASILCRMEPSGND